MSNADRDPAPLAAAETIAAAAEETTEEGSQGPSLLELLLGKEDTSPPLLASRIDGVVVGRIVSVEAGTPHVTFAGAPKEGFPARVMATVSVDDEGREVALMFDGGDPRRPLVMGKMVSPLAPSEGAEGNADGQG